jgi:hypothetical protein
MSFRPGHKKQGGRTSGTPNKLTGEAREVARRLLGDAEYQRSLQKRLIRGEASRIELHLWQLAFGTPRVEPETAPEGTGASAGLLQILEKLAEPATHNVSSQTSPSPGVDSRDTEEELP